MTYETHRRIADAGRVAGKAESRHPVRRRRRLHWERRICRCARGRTSRSTNVLEGVAFAHAHGKRAYLTLNLFSHNRDIEKLPEYVQTIRKVGPDELIVADPGVFNYVKQAAPELEIHISTQANVCSWLSAEFWKNSA